jgi:hypothetical protein
MAERNAAVHAPRTLALKELGLSGAVEFLPVLDSARSHPVWRNLTLILHESGDLTH